MKLKKFIPKNVKRAVHHVNRALQDFRKGYYSRFAKATNTDQLIFNYKISHTQPIKRSHLYENKIENIRLAGAKIEQFVLQPGEVFSFWRIIGKPSRSNGFRKGRNVISGAMAEDYGGGLCQLSGIIYHVSLMCGLEIIERYNHSIDFYTDETRFTPIGSDATVVYGYKDLRIGNGFDFPVKFSFEILDEQLIMSLWSTEPVVKKNIVFEKKEQDTLIEVTGRNEKGEVLNRSKYLKPRE